MMSFGQYCQSDALSPRETTFGTNLEANDGNIGKNGNLYYAMFKQGDLSHIVTIDADNGEFGMGTYDGNNINPNDYDNTASKQYKGNPVSAFGEAIYVALQIAKKYQIQQIMFSRDNNSLAPTFNFMVKNEHFCRAFKEMGWEYDEIKNYSHVFSDIRAII